LESHDEGGLLMGIFCDFFIHTRLTSIEDWNKLCNNNEIFGINRIAFESQIDDEIKMREK